MHSANLVCTRRYYGEGFCVVVHVHGHRSVRRIPGNGRRISFRMLHIFEFRLGKINRENVWMDTVGVMAQLAPA